MTYSKDLAPEFKQNILEPLMLDKDFTDKVYNGEVINRQSTQADLSRLITGKNYNHAGKIFFLQYFFDRYLVPEIGGCNQAQHRLRLQLYCEDTLELQQNCYYMLEKLEDMILSDSASKFGNLIDGVNSPASFPGFQYFGSIENRGVYVGFSEYLLS